MKSNALTQTNPGLPSVLVKKDSIKFVLKALLGAMLIYYVLHSKMVDFSSLHALLFQPRLFLTALFFMTFSMACCALRWNVLVRTQGLSLGFKDLIELTMIGMFFNSFMPGSVGGDFIKAWYVAGQEPQRKTKAVFTVLFDRAIGLWVFLAAAAMAVLLYPEWLVQRPELRLLAVALWAFTGAGIVVGALFFISRAWPLPFAGWFAVRLKTNRHAAKLIDTALLHRESIPCILLAVGLSVASILSSVFMFRCLGHAIGIPLAFSAYFFIVPVALTVSAVPVLPGGLGVGQVAFFTLFSWIGTADPGQGATLCTLFQIYTLIFNCLGAIFYLKFKRKPAAQPTPAVIGNEVYR